MIALELVWQGQVLMQLSASGHAADARVCASVSALLRGGLAALARWPESRLKVDAKVDSAGLANWSLREVGVDAVSWLEGWSALLAEVLRQLAEQSPADLRVHELLPGERERRGVDGKG